MTSQLTYHYPETAFSPAHAEFLNSRPAPSITPVALGDAVPLYAHTPNYDEGYRLAWAERRAFLEAQSVKQAALEAQRKADFCVDGYLFNVRRYGHDHNRRYSYRSRYWPGAKLIPIDHVRAYLHFQCLEEQKAYREKRARELFFWQRTRFGLGRPLALPEDDFFERGTWHEFSLENTDDS